jgi:hypothetical protein
MASGSRCAVRGPVSLLPICRSDLASNTSSAADRESSKALIRVEGQSRSAILWLPSHPFPTAPDAVHGSWNAASSIASACNGQGYSPLETGKLLRR